MRSLLVLLFLFIAGTSFADDSLESLNTVEDTLSTMQQSLKLQAGHGDNAALDNLAAGDETSPSPEREPVQDPR